MPNARLKVNPLSARKTASPRLKRLVMVTPSASTVLKAFDVLALFAERQMVGASEAAELLNCPRASAHRMLVTLKTAGVLEMTDPGQYQLSMRLFELGSFAPLRERLHEAAIRSLLRLTAYTRLPVQLAVREDCEVLYLERLGYRENNLTSPGRRGPLHATGVGKVLLANAPKQFRNAFFERSLQAYTEHTVIDPARLQGELERVRHRDLAHGRQERYSGFFSLARPIRDRQGDVIASISVVAPEVVKDRLCDLEVPLLQASKEIEHRLHARPLPDAATAS